MQFYAATMFAAGIGVPLLAAISSALGRHIEAPLVASAVLLGVGFLTAATVVMINGPQAVAKLATAPKHLFLGGMLIAFYVLTVTIIAPKFGVGNAIFFVLIGQLVSAATIDHFGLFGAIENPLTPRRALGIAVMGLGVLLTQTA